MVLRMSDQLVALWAEKLHSRRLTVVAVGDLGVEEMIDSLRGFESWTGGEASSAGIPAGTWHAGRARETREKAQTAIAKEDIERARNYAAGALQLRLQSSRALAGEILDAWVHGDLESLPALPESLRAVTSDDVRQVAAAAFRAEERAEFVVGGLEHGHRED